jgi:hypothetical protein
MDEDLLWKGLLVLDSEAYKLAELAKLGGRLRRMAQDDYVHEAPPIWRTRKLKVK